MIQSEIARSRRVVAAEAIQTVDIAKDLTSVVAVSSDDAFKLKCSEWLSSGTFAYVAKPADIAHTWMIYRRGVK